MAGSIVADIDRHPRAVGTILWVATERRRIRIEHHLNVVLPGAHVLLVLGLDWADVIRGAEGDGIPEAGGLRGRGEVVVADVF